MNLIVSKTPRQLENKLKLLGFELIDLLLIFLYLSTSNLIFGQTTLKLPLVYIGSLALALTLYFTKRGKPENYLSDKLSSFVTPSIFSANLPDIKYQPYLKGRRMKKQKVTPLTNFSEFQKEYSLAEELPFWDFFDDSLALSDSTLVQGLKLEGLSIETLDDNSLNAITLKFRSFLNGLQDNVEIGFFINSHSDFNKILKEHKNLGAK